MNVSKIAEAPANGARGVRIDTGSRLHFGLLDTVAPFGGLGVMISEPTTRLLLERSGSFECDSALRERVEPVACRIKKALGHSELPRLRVTLERSPKSHCGLGSGTQISMGVTEGICKLMGLGAEPEGLIEIADRAKRSAVGVHGYFRGGLIYETAVDRCDTDLNPINQRLELPESWRAAVFLPKELPRLVSGSYEAQQFQKVSPAAETVRDEMEVTIVEEILPAAASDDFLRFADAVHRYNYKSGLLFQEVQGGPYNGQAVSDLASQLIASGAKGVGQSSWGPSVFAWFPNQAEAVSFAADVESQCELINVAKPRNHGRGLTFID